MSITTSVDLFCDKCSVWIHTGLDLKPSEARARARKKGWVRRRQDWKLKDLCPDCAQKTDDCED